jgi:Asp-tRNA(Asn)/Glu-tRNA(Gln) amidotransferase A subunit family amidase
MQWFSRLQEDGASYAEVLRSPRRRDLLGETARLPAGRSRHTLPGLAVLWLERVSAMLPDDRSAFLADARALRDALDAQLGDSAVLLHPTFTRGAPRHRHALVRNTFDAMCTAVFNVTESPVSVVPAGRDRRDMPIGVQIVAARGRDHIAIAAAEALERALGGWTPAMWPDDDPPPRANG